MSGGAYNYLCYKTVESFDANTRRDARDMATFLRDFSPDGALVAEALEWVLSELESEKDEHSEDDAWISPEVLFQTIRPVFKTVEWYVSADWTREAVTSAIQAVLPQLPKFKEG
jgi:hypothetical protein